MVDDLLSAFLGLSGTYIRAKRVDAVGGARLAYEIITKGQLEPALQEMAARMLPLWCGGRGLGWGWLGWVRGGTSRGRSCELGPSAGRITKAKFKGILCCAPAVSTWL